MLNNYVCALDIGSSKIVAAVAKMRKRRIENIFFDSVPSKGMRHGTIVDSINLVEAVTKLMKNLKAKSGINIKLININISGQDILTKHSRAIVPLAERGSKVITLLDIQKVNEQARILGSSLDEEIIHAIPLTYSIDSKSNIANPLGLYSHKLEVDLYLVCARLSCVQSLARAINQSGYEIKNLFFSGLASSTVVFDKELKEGTNLFCDIGSETTELLVFSNGELKDIEILSFGGNDLTASLQDALKIPFELAEEIKTSYGIVGESQQISIDKEILVKKNDFYKPIKQRIVSEVITSSAKLICTHIKESVDKKIPAYEVNNFIIVGRTVLLEGFIETLENTLSITAKLGRILNPGMPSSIKEVSTLSQTAYLTYLTSLGIICLALTDRTVGTLPVNEPSKNIIVKTFNRFKEAYQEYF
jgi:cell division protein FtsA